MAAASEAPMPLAAVTACPGLTKQGPRPGNRRHYRPHSAPAQAHFIVSGGLLCL